LLVVGIARAVDGRLLAEDRKRGEPEGGLVWGELRKLTTGTVAGRVPGLVFVSTIPVLRMAPLTAML